MNDKIQVQKNGTYSLITIELENGSVMQVKVLSEEICVITSNPMILSPASSKQLFIK